MTAQFLMGVLLGYFIPRMPKIPGPKDIPPGPWNDLPTPWGGGESPWKDLPGPWNGGKTDPKPKPEPKKPDVPQPKKPLQLDWPLIPIGWSIPKATTTPTTTPTKIETPLGTVDIDPGGEGMPLTDGPVTTVAPQATSYVIKSGDYPSGLAQKKTGDAGRWRELLTANPDFTTYTDANGATQIKPWNVGQTIMLPPGWA